MLNCTRDNLTALIKKYIEYLEGEAEMRRGRGRGGRQWWITMDGLGILMDVKGMRRHNNENVSNTQLMDDPDKLKQVRERERQFKEAVLEKKKEEKRHTGLDQVYLNDPFIKMRMEQIDLEIENQKLKEELAALKSTEEQPEQISMPLPDKTERMEVNELVRDIARAGESFARTWDELYKEFSIRTGTNWSLRAYRSEKKTIDVIEEAGCISQLLELAKIMHRNYFNGK